MTSQAKALNVQTFLNESRFSRYLWTVFILCFLIVLLLSPRAADAQEASVSEPSGINLGKTSFFDGFQGDPGWAYLAYLTHSTADTFRDQNGNENPSFDHPKLTVTTLLHQLSYWSPKTIGNSGAHLGFSLILPMVSTDGDFGSAGAQLRDNGAGMGDITIGPNLQFDPLLDPTGRPFYVQRLSLDVILPTGKYDSDRDLNQGSNTVSLNPFWAASWMPVPGWELSWRLNYLHNFKNTDPASSSPAFYRGDAVRNTQAGASAWLNFAGSYEIRPGISIGLNGYYFKQIKDDKVNGERLANSREQVLGIGPGAFWRVKKDLLFWFNTYHETQAKNRSASDVIVQFRLARAI